MNGFRWAKECGFDGVELILCDPNLIDVSKIGNAAASLGLSVSTIATGQAGAVEGFFMTSPVEYIRKATLQRIFDDIDFSCELGRPNVTIGLIRGSGGLSPRERDYELLETELLKAAEYAAKKNVRLNLEPINRFECKLLNSTRDTYDFLTRIGSPENVGILFDTFHANIEDVGVVSTLADTLGRVAHVHFADSNRRLPGEGHIDFSGVYACLKEKGYDGYISLEVYNIPDQQYIVEHAGERLCPYLKVVS
jgi:sugar phosphate isomerase/epimerase